MSMGWLRSLDKSALVSALLLIALGTYAAVEAWDWPYLTKDGPGPGFFPLWIGIAMIVLSVALIVMQVAAAAFGKVAEKTSWKGAGGVFVGWAALMVAAALLKPAGFVASYVLLTAFLVRVVFRQSWVATLAVSVVSAIAFWFLFVKLLRVQLPAGPWGF